MILFNQFNHIINQWGNNKFNMDKEITRLFDSGTSKVYICNFCGNFGPIDKLLFRNKIFECCPICHKSFFNVYDWVDFILEYNNIIKNIERIKSRKNIYNRRSKVKLVLNDSIIEKIKNEGAIKNITCPNCGGHGHYNNFIESETFRGFISCGKCNGSGIIKVNKTNYLEYIEKDK